MQWPPNTIGRYHNTDPVLISYLIRLAVEKRWKNALAVPHAVLKIEVAEPRPVAPRADLIALTEKIPERVGFDHHGADAELVEQGSLRKRKILLAKKATPSS